MRHCALIILCLLLLAPAVLAAEPDVILYPHPLSDSDTRFDYHLSLLQEALKRTVPEYGPFVLRPTQTEMNQLRQFKVLQEGTPQLDVAIKPTSVEREQLLTPVRIPLEKGLLGWRILLIHRRNQGLLAKVKSLKELWAFSCGQGLGWSDVRILRHNGLSVVEGTTYEGLFKMLLADRFQIFPRGAGEAFVEWDERHESLPDLQVEKTLLLHYPFARYFWTANSERGTRLRERITEGLESMLSDGTFDALFQEQYKDIIDRAQFGSRVYIRLDNPDIPPCTPLDRSCLWYNPFDD